MSLVPYFFLIYINSLFSCPFKGLLTAFADDVGFSYGSNSVLDLISDLNWDLFLLRDWFAKHSLSISSKTKIMFFSLSTQSIIGPELFIMRLVASSIHCQLVFAMQDPPLPLLILMFVAMIIVFKLNVSMNLSIWGLS